MRNFLELYQPLVTTWQVYDNSNGCSRLIAFNNSYFDTVVDEARWNLFNRSADNGGEDNAAGE